jgi:MurNAc alpha-1-phosphate uridylyltransferase
MPTHAFILAAGMGTRLRPYTDSVPKPLIPVGGKPMIDHTLDKLAAVGVQNVTINIHYMADQFRTHLTGRTSPGITFSPEPQLLNTGGGIKAALHTIGNQPFFCFSGDTLWDDGPSGDTLKRLAAAWNDSTMDLLLLLQPRATMAVTEGSGDYTLDSAGKPCLTPDKSGEYFWPSVRIIHPRLFNNTPDTPFSFLDLMKKAESNGRLGALVHDGTCYHISTPEDLSAVNKRFFPPAPQPVAGPEP